MSTTGSTSGSIPTRTRTGIRRRYQILQSIFAQADGGLFGKGFGQALITIPGTDNALLPAAQTDTIYSLIVNEVGLFGACAVILAYLLFAARGFKIALLANDGFSKLLATGLTAVFAIQAFVIIGGVTRVIPLTGVTLPFVSYGGSSIVANFVLLALLLLVSDRARREARMASVNRQIVKLFAFIVVLFAVLVGFTSYWSVFDAKALKEKDANNRPLLEQQQIRRGRIVAADGTVIARSVAKGHGDARRYVSRYPKGSLFGHPIGYSFVQPGRHRVRAVPQRRAGRRRIGIQLDPRPAARPHAGRKRRRHQPRPGSDSGSRSSGLAGRPGSAPWWRSSPRPGGSGCWLRTRRTTRTWSRNTSANSTTSPTSPLFNRATQGQYPPGSTFKVVTAAAGLDSGAITPETAINAPGTLDVQGQPLANDFNQDWGSIPLDTALTNSVNTWFAQLGEKVGAGNAVRIHGSVRLRLEAGDRPARPTSSRPAASSKGAACSAAHDPVDIARIAIGQERLAVTPLQMAEVAAAVANGGRLMKPQIWSRVVDPDGRVTKRLDPSEYSEPIDGETAAELTTAMEGVVNEGTGTNAAISGVPVAGKTGTAETPFNETCGGADVNQAWFIGFAPGGRTEDRDRCLDRVHQCLRWTMSRRRSSAKSRKPC